MLDQANRTFICSVVFIDLVGYSKKPVTEQIRLKTSLTNNLSEAIKDIPVNDRIILDTGDGAAISFLGDPEDALFVTLQLREMMMAEAMTATQVEASGDDAVRMGINLGPVKLVKDINGHPNIIGDGINVAQRIMSFARPGQIVVSRSYYDVVSNLASEYAKLFTYEGSRTDKHVREHEIYVVGHSEGALQKAKDGMKDRASATTPRSRPATAAGSSTVTLTIPTFAAIAQDKKKLTMIAGALTVLVLILLIAFIAKRSSKEAEPLVATAPTTTTAPGVTSTTHAASPPAAPATAAEPPRAEVKPDTKVLEPVPSPSIIPAPAPAASPNEGRETHAKNEPAKSAPAKASEKPEPRAEPRSEPAKQSAPPATIVFAVSPWGEIVVNGKSRGVTPPMKSIKLEPGKYKIEVRNTTFPVHTETLDLKARDEITVRHKFQ
jgi:class 3 adenylate cyclase